MHHDTTTQLDPSRFCPDCGRAGSGALCERCGSTLAIQGYCPICESRIRRRIGELCPKHDVELLPGGHEDSGIPPEAAPISWVTVKQFADSPAVNGARIRLEAEGIPTFVEGERMGAPTMYRVATGGVKLQVPSEYAADARVILSQGWSWPDDELNGDEETEVGDADPPSHEGDSPRALLIEALVILGLAIPMIAALIAYLRAE